jgi:hypothetical protein
MPYYKQAIFQLHLFLCCRGCVDCERFSPRADEPSVPELAVVLERLQLDLLKWDDVLLVVLLLVDDDVAVDQQIVEEEELARLELLPARLCENTFADEDATGNSQRLTRRAKAALDKRDAPSVSLAVH